MSRRIGLLILTLVSVAGCAPQPAAVVTMVPTSTAAPVAALLPQDAVALADKFYDLFITRQDYAGAVAAYLLQVDSEDDTPEPGRDPTWFPPDQAKQKLAERRSPQYQQVSTRVIDEACRKLRCQG